MHKASTIANHFIRLHAPDNTPMKLQKLVYYAHGWNLALNNRALINEQIEAWDYGPVARSLFSATKRYGDNPVTSLIVTSNAPVSASPNMIGFLDQIWRIYGHFSGIQLSNMTHDAGTPWRKVYDKYHGNIPKGTDIPEDWIKSWFKAELQNLGQ